MVGCFKSKLKSIKLYKWHKPSLCKILVLPKPRYLTDVKSFLIKFSFAGKLCVKCFERVTAEKEIKFIKTKLIVIALTL